MSELDALPSLPTMTSAGCACVAGQYKPRGQPVGEKVHVSAAVELG